MGFNRQRPESLNTSLKRISIEFCDSNQSKERSIISNYVNSIVGGSESRNVCIDDWRVLSSVDANTRRHQRIKFNQCFIHAITIKGNSYKVIKLSAELIDLSVGGACIAIPEGLKVIRKKKQVIGDYSDEAPNIKIKLDFLQDIVMKGVIRNLKEPKVDPNIDLDNFDFEYVLPQYWKVNG